MFERCMLDSFLGALQKQVMHHQHQLQQGGLAQFLHMNSTFGTAQENKPKKTTETWYMLSRQYRQPIINFIHMIIT